MFDRFLYFVRGSRFIALLLLRFGMAVTTEFNNYMFALGFIFVSFIVLYDQFMYHEDTRFTDDDDPFFLNVLRGFVVACIVVVFIGVVGR